jgi:hypothetical protein
MMPLRLRGAWQKRKDSGGNFFRFATWAALKVAGVLKMPEN